MELKNKSAQKDYVTLLKSFTRKDYDHDVNLHVHTTYSDGKGDAENLLKQAHEKGYRYIAISDHNTLDAYFETKIASESILIPAIEFDCWCGTVFLHMLGYGIDINCPELQAMCATTKRETEVDVIRLFSKRQPKDVIDTIHKAGGIAILAHPACCFVANLDKFVKKLKTYGLDGMEVYYPYERHRGVIKFNTVKNVEKIADKYGMIKTGGTDCHAVDLPII